MSENKNVFKNALKEIKHKVIYMENKSLDYNNMAKNIKLNVNILNALTSKIKNEALKEKANNLIQLYAGRKLTQKTQAENQIIDFITYEKEKPRRQKTIDKTYDNLISKYSEAKPLNERMKTNQWVSSITVGDAMKAKTDITIHLKQQNNLLSSRNSVLIHNSIYKTILEATKKLIEVRKV